MQNEQSRLYRSKDYGDSKTEILQASFKTMKRNPLF